MKILPEPDIYNWYFVLYKFWYFFILNFGGTEPDPETSVWLVKQKKFSQILFTEPDLYLYIWPNNPLILHFTIAIVDKNKNLCII